MANSQTPTREGVEGTRTEVVAEVRTLDTAQLPHPRPQPPIPTAELDPRRFRPAYYVIRLDRFHIDQTRSKLEDTDTVTLAVKVGEKVIGPMTYRAGDVENGDHPIDLRIGPFFVGSPYIPVTFNYAIVNVGGGPGDWVKKLEEWSAGALAKYFSFGTDVFKDLVDWITNWFEHACDGAVVADQINLSGEQLWQWTFGTGARSETRYYPGNDSPALVCNSDNSEYYLTWTVAGVGIASRWGASDQIGPIGP